MMIQWWEHSQKGVTDDGQTDRQTDGRTDRQTDWTIHRAAWSQLKSTSPHSLIEHIKIHSRFLMIMSGFDVSNTTQSVTQFTVNNETYKSTYHWRILFNLNSDFLLRTANVTVLLLCYTPPETSQMTHCHGYGYCWLWRYKVVCVIVMCHVACIVLCRPKQCWRWRTRGKGLGRYRAICMNGVAWNKNILPMVALDEYIYRDDGLLQNTDCLQVFFWIDDIATDFD